jgi:hypothetical protein
VCGRDRRVRANAPGDDVDDAHHDDLDNELAAA